MVNEQNVQLAFYDCAVLQLLEAFYRVADVNRATGWNKTKMVIYLKYILWFGLLFFGGGGGGGGGVWGVVCFGAGFWVCFVL